MTQLSCETCSFFTPAPSRTERPAWGQCLKLVKGKIGTGAEKPRPLFTWADNHCDDFERRESSVVGR